MHKKLNIGIFHLTNSWRVLLEQIGVSYSTISTVDEISVDEHSLIIINKPLLKKETDRVKDYVHHGGAIIDTGSCIEKIVHGNISKKKYIYIIPNNIPFTPPMNIIDLYSSVYTFSKAQYLNKTLYVDNFGNGLLSFLGLDIDTLLLNTRSKRKEFYASSPRFPNEETALVSKGEIIRLIFYLMRYLHIARGIPFVHKWFFPNQAKNIFMFRIDSDFGNKNQIKQWYDIAKSSGIKCTWFLHIAAHKDWLDTFSEFKDHEIAVHGYEHYTSKDYSKNETNIEKALHLLQKTGFSCSGYAAPYGLWSEKLNSVCEKFGFQYSSEFSYIYDALPIRAVFKNHISSVLQIPIHPICIGSLIRAKANHRDIIDYFTNEFQRQMMHCNPLIFYDHVLHKQSSILTELFQQINSFNIPVLTFSEYSDWWNIRENSDFSASLNAGNIIQVNTSKQDKQCFLCIWTDINTYILTNSNGIINTTTEQINKIDYNKTIDTNKLKATRKFNLRLHKQSILNRLIWRKSK